MPRLAKSRYSLIDPLPSSPLFHDNSRFPTMHIYTPELFHLNNYHYCSCWGISPNCYNLLSHSNEFGRETFTFAALDSSFCKKFVFAWKIVSLEISRSFFHVFEASRLSQKLLYNFFCVNIRLER